ncbi:MAG: KdsC family phosphatase [Nitrosopumilaceae archaeon]
MKKSTEKIKQKCSKIKLVLTDVDGVLTDGGRYYSKDGEVIKKFHTRDGMGVNILLRNGIKTCILTKEKSEIVKKWAEGMNVFEVYEGVVGKELELNKICKKFGLKNTEIAYVGDDINDLELMKTVGFSATPHDGIFYAKQFADYICEACGGQGAFREVVDLIVTSKFAKKTKWY